MEMDALLNMVFAAVISGLGWWIKSQHDEIRRVTILLNRTREELGRDYVSKIDSNQVLMQIMSKFDKLEEKIDRLMERQAKWPFWRQLQQQYQAEARKARRAAQRQKEKEREELMEAIAWSLSGMAAIGGVGALIYFLGRYMEKW